MYTYDFADEYVNELCTANKCVIAPDAVRPSLNRRLSILGHCRYEYAVGNTDENINFDLFTHPIILPHSLLLVNAVDERVLVSLSYI